MFEKTSRIKNTGNMMISMSIALTIAAILSLASAKYAINKFNEDKGTLVGNQLQTVINAVNAYITDHTDEISNKPMIVNDIVGYSNKFKPTASELKNAGYLGSDFSTTPILGGSYTIEIKQLASSCQLNCLIGSVYLIKPIGVVNNNAVDIKILGAAVAASKTGQIGYSTPGNKNFISGPWASTSTILNPDQSKRAGILYATTSVLSNTEKHWLPPFSTWSNSPRRGNITGDVRIALDTKKPYVWDESYKDWLEFFSSDQSLLTVSIGRDSGSINSLKNTFIGFNSGKSTIGKTDGNLGGQQNTMIGTSSGISNTYGSNNVFLGHFSGSKNTVGNKNIYIGANSGSEFTAQSNNIIMGNFNDDTAVDLANSQYNIFIGKHSGSAAAKLNNIHIGTNSGKNNTGSSNIFVGNDSGINSSGNLNSFFGHNSGIINSSGRGNTFTGYDSGQSNSSGMKNVYSGYLSGIGLNGDNNTTIGYNSGYNSNNAVNLISNITAIGSDANTEAQYATAIGSSSKARSIQSTSIGSKASISTNASNATAIGYSATVTGINSTAIGNNTQVSGQNSVAIGNGTIVNTPNTVVIGDKDIQTVYIGSGNAELKTASVDKSSSVTLTSTGNIIATGNINSNTITTTNIFCTTCMPLPTGSDKRLKETITDTPRDLSFIKKLRPVDYTLISNGQPQTGFIAQEVESADPDFPGIVKPQNDRDFYALTYTAFIPAIVKSIQQLDARLDKIAPATLATSATAPASVSGLANGATPAPASADLSLLKWLVLFLSVCVLSCLAVIVRFYKELQAMRLSVQRLAIQADGSTGAQ